ncbi:hypothetical protein J4E85_009919, partial [Alternaria conjuncta]|uniref:uncharacterized protein n=1 Tax=Alternaria conjuncta TaxID=181017 RepID=UPI00221EA6D7
PLLPPGITIPPLPVTTLVPTGTEVQSSASDLSIAILGVFPILQNWIEDPVAHVTEVTDELDNIIPDAVGFLAKLPKPTDGVEPCGSGKRRRSERDHELHDVLSERDLLGGLFKTAFSLVNCVINTTNKVKDAVIGGTTAAVDTVKGLQDDLKPLLDALNEVVPDEASEPSDSVSVTEEPTQTSSSTCTLTTLSAEGLAPVETGRPTNHVSKRSLSSPYGSEHNGDVGAWLLDQIEDSLNPYGSLEQGRGTTGLTFPLEDTADDWHLVNLWGCTSVVVISRKRMFLTHIWEKPSMEQPQLFQSDVLDVLRNGSPEFSHPLTVFTVPGEGFENIAENKQQLVGITGITHPITSFDCAYSVHPPDNDQAVNERLKQRKFKPTALVDSHIITNFKVFFDVGDSPSTTKTPSAVPKPSPASQPPPPPQTEPPTKALSVIFRNTKGSDEDYNNWTFFEIKPNTQADGCSVPVLNDVSRQWLDTSALSTPPWPHGTFTMPLFGEEDCEYLSDGTNAGVLHCPSMGDGKTVGCKEADEKDDADGVTDCNYPGLERKVHIVVYCEW